ncbi:MAG: signal peptidase I [Luteolibacter sp.]
MDKVTKGLVYLMILVSVILCILRVCGLVRPFSIPTSAMAPTISRGDLIVMENFTYLSRKPQRGDLAVFKTDGIPSLAGGSIYVKRVAGLPGDRMRIADGKLYVNGKHLPLRNQSGDITYLEPRPVMGKQKQTSFIDVTVPQGHYYVLGDNQPNSLDSRYWGFVPEQNFIGRGSFCISPPRRIGRIK